MAVGAELEKFAVDSAKADDIAVADVYAKAGAKVFDLDDATLKKWQASRGWSGKTTRTRTELRRCSLQPAVVSHTSSPRAAEARPDIHAGNPRAARSHDGVGQCAMALLG